MANTLYQLITSQDPKLRQWREDIFEKEFQEVGYWRMFLDKIDGTIDHQISDPAARWTVETFQSLYIACWVHFPVEKGTYMIELRGCSPEAQAAVQSAIKTQLYVRSLGSSHLSCQGSSASQGWAFLKGYHELLVQYETQTGPSLLLKCEGHTTGPGSVIPHLRSWMVKNFSGAGRTASAKLQAAAAGSLADVITPRAAENFSPAYQELLNMLGLSGRQTTIREVLMQLEKLLLPNRQGLSFNPYNTDQELGQRLNALVGDAKTFMVLKDLRKVTLPMMQDLEKIAARLMSHPAGTVSDQVFQEVRVTPKELDESLQYHQLDQYHARAA